MIAFETFIYLKKYFVLYKNHKDPFNGFGVRINMKEAQILDRSRIEKLKE